ncbi:hypothetical protein FRC02_003523 [Tulasnella sp. 418]|nr:hypothetical protein FRC02_003523 [Tulasnella sp. 418]
MDAIVDIFDPNNPPKGLSIPCNGSPFLCSRKYGNITHIGAHNSFGATDNPLELSANQKWDVTKQLDAGVRLLQGQVHLDGGKMKLCHSYCMDPIFYDAGPVVNYLKKVKKWLDANPGQVVTILFGNPDRHKGADLETQWHPQFVNSGLEPLIYRPPPEVVYREDWPTLQEILDQGKRLIVFLSYGANRTRVDYLLPEFDHMWETPFTITDKKRLKECELDRPSSIGTNGSMYLMHHSLNYRFMGTPGVVPTRYGAKEINTFNSILEHSQACAKMANRWPNFILMDFIDVGEPFKAMRYFNNV